ncbi:Calx-beta domain-containing protein [Aerosakkonemataceae cyanobacterium BLCC-F154]|uniref:Calx-beta domain-containing protein n=1 Tax=Floridaenema fluviatile BLCC-F154 TaxID=3153640 RepID=A0ABV4YF64_9CYAN
MATIIGTPGSDFLVGTKDPDLILGLAGNDLELGLEAGDSLFGNEGQDFIFGGTGNDLINGNEDNDRVNGNEDNDTVYGGMGNDEVRGGQDNDLLFGDLGNDSVFGDLDNDTMFGGVGTDLLDGNAGNDVINGNQDNDSIFGSDGNDLLYGGQQDDLLVGDTGLDTIFGNLGNDSAYGGADDDYLNGNEGDDFLSGNDGFDTIYGGQNNDSIFGGKDNDLLSGDKGNDTIFGNLGRDTISGGEGADVLNGNEDRDTVFGGQGEDLIYGGQEDDVLYGDKGNDVVFGNLGNDSLFGGVGTDFLNGNEGDDTLNGNEENDTVYGGQGNDIVRGGMGNDSLFGDKGNDTIYGDLGADTLTGNSGDPGTQDIFVVGLSGNAMAKTTGGLTIADADVITDWDQCIDKISLTGGLSFDDIVLAQGTGANATNTIVSISNTFKGDGAGEFLVVLKNVNVNNIDGTSFIDSNGKIGPARPIIVATDDIAIEPVTTPNGILTNNGEFTIFVPCKAENDTPITYTITGNATPNDDYQALSGVAIIPKGSNKATIPVVPIADNITEAPETVTITLDAKGAGFVAGTPQTATVTIFDSVVTDKPLVFVTAPDPTAFEDGTKAGTFQFARTGGDVTQDLTISYTVTGTATPGTDYNPTLSGTVIIPAGKSVSDLISVTPVNDGINEPTETIVVSVAQESDYFVGSQSSANVSILDSTPLTVLPGSGEIFVYNNNNKVSSHTKFSDAVNAAQSGNLIVAGPGTYDQETGTIIVDKTLTIRGPNAGLSPTSGLTATPALVKAPGSTPVFTILPGKDVTIEGLRIEMNGDNSNAIRYQSNQADSKVVIRQNEFTGKGPATGGVIFLDFENASGSSAKVIDNLIRDVTSGSVTSGVQAFRVGTATITNNLVANVQGPGILADSVQTGSKIISNIVSDTGEQGIQLAGGSATIANNDITNTNLTNEIASGGIRLRESGLGGGTIQSADIFSNIITKSFNGIAVRDGSAIVNGTVNINRNNLIGNSKAGFYHGGTGTIDATNNWWDNASGPVVGGTGPNAILGPGAGSVDFNPFATAPF